MWSFSKRKDTNRVAAYAGLDEGEAQVLVLAEEQNASLVLIDEYKARRYAERLKLPLSGTLGVLLLAKEEKIIPAIAPLLDLLHKYSPEFGSSTSAWQK